MSRLPADAPRRRRVPQWGGAVEPILPLPGDPSDPAGFPVLGEQHRQWMAARRLTPNAQRVRMNNLRYFAAWCLDRGITQPGQVTFALVEQYQRHVFHYRKEDGQPLAVMTQAARVGQVGIFCGWLTRRRLISVNPAADVELPRRGVRLPRGVLTLDQVEALLAVPDVATRRGLRNRAVLELLFATGMRREELARLRPDDLRPDGTVLIEAGKGGRDRLVPLGAAAAHWVARYAREVRPHWRPDPDIPVLFLTPRRAPMGLPMLTNTVREYAHQAGITVRGGCHLLRHTCATLMLANGADVRVVQELLGHADIHTTQRYTHLAIGVLQDVHRRTHPAECGRITHAAETAEAAAARAAMAAWLAQEQDDAADAADASTPPA
jgi:integrase/recombinase XerD